MSAADSKLASRSRNKKDEPESVRFISDFTLDGTEEVCSYPPFGCPLAFRGVYQCCCAIWVHYTLAGSTGYVPLPLPFAIPLPIFGGCGPMFLNAKSTLHMYYYRQQIHSILHMSG